ncbi:MAG: acetylornithine/N-succinyldiaminopimelate aminotransferase [Gaiellaceae bacterium]|nr:acetylornithine/N-succinyldiaminopimelate aminotransferase [Gaiellaceae bacterium]
MSATELGAPVLPTYARADVTFVDGNGCVLTDSEGKQYLDLVGGIAVVALGHRHPAPLAAAHAQLDRLWHVSNLYWSEPMAQLAGLLSARFGGAQAFFCNSGAEAIEAAIKYARKATGKTGLVALENSFHGRTLGALSVTGQPSKRAAFEPLVPGARFAKLNDTGSLADAVDDDTALILIEPIQGEGGINPASAHFLEKARELADAHGALLVFDEIQCGMGRTGSFFAWQRLGVKPHAVTLAKALANGLPIGALLVADEHAGAFAPGDHASTFGGNPVVCAAACAVVETMTDDLLADVGRKSVKLFAGLEKLPSVVEVRGGGLLLGVELDRAVSEIVNGALERGVLVCSAGERVLRLTPPLTITDEQIDHALNVLHEVIA